MNKAYLAKFIGHILSRQGSLPLKDVFRFSHWRTRTGELRASRYPERDGNNQIVHGTKAPVKRRKAKKTSAPQASDMVGPATTTGPGHSSTPDTTGPAITPTLAPTTDVMTQNSQRIGAPRPRQRLTHRMTQGPAQVTTAPAAAQEQPMQVISQAEMTQLALSGHPAVIPMNGPGSGPPQYLVSSETIEALRQQPTPQASPERPSNERPAPQIDPALLDLESNVPAVRNLRSGSKRTGPVAEGNTTTGNRQLIDRPLRQQAVRRKSGVER